MRVVVVDDEDNGRELLIHMLNKYCEDIVVCGIASDVSSAIKVIDEEKPDLLFLDIEMPGGSGFDVLDNVSHVVFSVIFVTGYDHYAIRAIKYAALDYLLKPIDLKELKKAVEKAKDVRKNWRPSQLDQAKAKSQQDKTGDILIQGKFKNYLIAPDRILYLKSDGNYSEIYIDGSESVMASKNLNFFQHLLEQQGFFRVHRSYIVNLLRVKGFGLGRKMDVELDNDQKLPLAIRRKGEFIKKLEAYNSKKS